MNEKYKLNLDIVPQNADYRTPIGWWDVETEGDCEGRSTVNLGTWWGHVAEIALSLGQSAYYSYQFSPATECRPSPLDKVTYRAVRRKASVSLGVGSKTWDFDPEERVLWFHKWLNTDDVVVLPSTCFATVVIEIAAASGRCLNSQ